MTPAPPAPRQAPEGPSLDALAAAARLAQHPDPITHYEALSDAAKRAWRSTAQAVLDMQRQYGAEAPTPPAPEEAQPMSDALTELRDRLAEKVPGLRTMASEHAFPAEVSRLNGKAEGVELALSFVDEAIRAAGAVPADPPQQETVEPNLSADPHWLRRVGEAAASGGLSEVLRDPAPSPDPESPPVPYNEHERALTQVMEERDHAQEMADAIAAAFVPAEVLGEHSNLNDPWQRALDYAAERAAGEPTDG